MNNYDIEAYLSGELSPDERQAFETEMAENPAFAQEVARQRLLSDDIEDAILWERIDAARIQPRQRWRWWLLALVLVLGAGLWGYFHPLVPDPTPPTEQPAPEPKAAPNKTQEVPSPANQPIADAKPDPGYTPPLYPAPQLRGQSTADTSRKALLDAIWHTEYPPEGLQLGEPYRQIDQLLRQRDFPKSYARLQLLERKNPASDTLAFLKGYCLLQQGEGRQALQYFDRIQNGTPFGNDLLEWYQGLAFVLAGENEKAKKLFTKISAKPEHAYKKQAAQALKML